MDGKLRELAVLVGAPNRRQEPRGTPFGEPTRNEIIWRILGTFKQTPGLTLSLEQAAPSFGLRDVTCRVVLDDLVAAGKLRKREDLYGLV